MRVLVVDDHAEVRRAIGLLLAESFAGAVMGQAGGAAEALAAVGAEPWDLVLLDLSLPDRSGIETLRELHRVRPALPVLVMSFHPEAQYATAVRAAGAAGYLEKGSAAAAVVAAIRSVLAHAL